MLRNEVWCLMDKYSEIILKEIKYSKWKNLML
jgi:hypothetical protein